MEIKQIIIKNLIEKQGFLKNKIMKLIIDKVKKLSKSERITRLIKILSKGNKAHPFEILEMELIQSIRENNGEIDEVKNSRK